MTSKNELQLIIFKLGESLYGVDINHIREVVDPKKIIKIPKAPEYIEGIMDLRGHVVTLISLSKILEIPTNGGKEKRKVLILMDNLNGNDVGFIVDHVVGVLRVHSKDIERTAIGREHVVRGVVRSNNNLILVLDPPSILKYLNLEEVK